MDSTGPFANRLRKNVRHLRKWAKREGVTAYRLYDLDIPEYPFAVDWYDGRVHVVEYPRRRAIREGTALQQREEVLRIVGEVLELDAARIFFKTHLPKKWGEEQYEVVDRRAAVFEIEEHGLRFKVNLSDYLDTGIFLDHRPLRAQVRGEVKGRRFLNLFAYTGTFTVHAAAGGAKSTTTVDLSNTYLDWAEENLRLNRLEGPQHTFVRADARSWLEDAAKRGPAYDVIVLDPPSFSTSKAMRGTLDVQRDHRRMVLDALDTLSDDGVLYFSNNFLGFELDPRLERDADVEEITRSTIPEDFRRDVHRCWRIRHAAQR